MKRKWLSITLCLLFTIICALPVSAEPLTGRWERGPAYGMAPTKSSPIVVEKQDVTFQITEKPLLDSPISSKVTETYRLKNPTSKSINIEMALPIISTFQQFSANGLELTRNGKKLPYTVCLTGPLPSLKSGHQLYDREGHLNSNYLLGFAVLLKNAVALPTNLKYIAASNAVLYQIKCKNQAWIRAEVTASSDKTKIISFGDDEPIHFGNNITFYGWLHDAESCFSFLIIGETPQNIKITPLKEKTDHEKMNIEPEITTTQVSPLNHCLKRLNSLDITDQKAQSITLSYLESRLEQYGTCNAIEQLYPLEEISQIYLLKYTVPFAANSEEEVTVSYTTVPTTYTWKDYETDQLFTDNTFAYLTNPAGNWASFQNSNITVIPPNKNCKLTSNTINLKADSSGKYQSSLTTLPQQNFTFTLRTKAPEEHTTSGFILPLFIYMFFIIGILLLVLIFYLLYKKRQKVNA